MDALSAGGIISLLLVLGLWGAWLSRRSRAPLAWAALTALAVLGGVAAAVLSASGTVPEGDVPVGAIGRGLTFSWAVTVSVGTLLAVHRQKLSGGPS